MDHDFSIEPEGTKADEFAAWLLAQTISNLTESYGDLEALKGSLFLFANRAYESKMPEEQIAEILGVSIVRAGYTELEEETVYDIVEPLAEVAKAVHKYNT